MKDQATTGNRAFDGSGVAQIANHRLDIQLANLTRGPDQRPYAMPALCQEPGHVPAKKARSAGDQRGLHLRAGPGAPAQAEGLPHNWENCTSSKGPG